MAVRSRYAPDVVAPLMVSPWFMHSGTSTTRPVSTVAGFVAPVAVSPLTPGSDVVIVSSTAIQQLYGLPYDRDAERLLAVEHELNDGALRDVRERIAQDLRRYFDLVVGLGVHERVQVGVAVEVLHLPAFDTRRGELRAGVERLLDGVATSEVAHLDVIDR